LPGGSRGLGDVYKRQALRQPPELRQLEESELNQPKSCQHQASWAF
jgi:hypothetical protein